jgi:hypothetical protein
MPVLLYPAALSPFTFAFLSSDYEYRFPGSQFLLTRKYHSIILIPGFSNGVPIHGS